MTDPTVNQIKPDWSDRDDFGITFVVQQGQIRVHTDLPYTNQLVAPISINADAQWFIGRSCCCAIVLYHSTISRHHAVLGYNADEGFYLMDLKSHNGTFLNQNQLLPLQTYVLQAKDRIQLADQTIQINMLYKDMEADA
jgi:pSer/pThr/pTyr-binding forkhead associated (FHA) protein